MKKEPFWVELSLQDETKEAPLLNIDLVSDQIWVDISRMGSDIKLCAMCDGIPFLIGQPEKKGDHQGYFVNIDWLIKEYGGDKKIIAAAKKCKEVNAARIPEYKEKYKAELKEHLEATK